VKNTNKGEMRDAWSSLLSSDNVTKLKTKDLSEMIGLFFMSVSVVIAFSLTVLSYPKVAISNYFIGYQAETLI